MDPGNVRRPREHATAFSVLLYLVVALAADPQLRAQARPDFSGAWRVRETRTMEGAREGRSGRGGVADLTPSFGPKFNANQSAEVLTIQRELRPGRLLETSYDLNGRPHSNLEGDENTESIATWRDSRLVIVTRDSLGRELLRVIWLEADELMVETSVRAQRYVTVYSRAR